eukprot:m.480560 g.480560  ORF g.480560 m.480560 type:complete len:65 (+) comp21707_c0_seq39:2711-2905(+)
MSLCAVVCLVSQQMMCNGLASDGGGCANAFGSDDSNGIPGSPVPAVPGAVYIHVCTYVRVCNMQ